MIDKALADSMRASSLAGSGTGMIIGGQTPLVSCMNLEKD